jgi:cobalamin biosynthetic protein CobC
MADLRAAAAAHFGVDARTVVAAPGSQSIIQWLPTLRAPGHVAVVSPTYTEHAACWRRAGHRVSAIAAPGEIPRDATAVVVTRPNNPDGRVVPFEWLAATATALARRGGLLVIDEAFADVEAAPSDSARLPPATTISLRSFGKFFGLAGARLGFALADGETGDRLRAALGPWPVAGPTIAVATRAYRDTDWIARTRRRLEHAANALDTLAGRSGLALVGGTSLYRLYRHGRARAVFERLAAAGIYVRRFTDQPDWLRIGLPPDAPARRRLERALGL